MCMREVRGGLEIKPGHELALNLNSGYHLMFMNLRQPLIQGDRLKGQLRFEKAGSVNIEYRIDSVGAPGPQQQRH